MRRREFITLVGGTVATLPLAARAQQPAMPVVGFLRSSSPDDSAVIIAGFRSGLSDIGFVEGSNVTVDYRFAQDRDEQLPVLAADLVRRRVSVIVAGPHVAAEAAKAATATIPIVFASGTD